MYEDGAVKDCWVSSDMLNWGTRNTYWRMKKSDE